MDFLANFLGTMDGNIIEYCILGGIVVLVIVLIISIISCIKSLDGKDSKRKYAKLDMSEIEDDKIETEKLDHIQELIDVAEIERKKEEEIIYDSPKTEQKIAEKIEIPDVIEDSIDFTQENKKAVEKLDIKSITHEMELKLEEESNDVDAYEDAQEKTAIISYKELLEAAAKIEANADNEESIDDVDVVFEFNSKKIVGVEYDTPKHAMKKFKPTIDISPVFGTRKERAEYIEQDDLFKIEEVEEDKKSLEEREMFLKNLQDFRSNLD